MLRILDGLCPEDVGLGYGQNALIDLRRDEAGFWWDNRGVG